MAVCNATIDPQSYVPQAIRQASGKWCQDVDGVSPAPRCNVESNNGTYFRWCRAHGADEELGPVFAVESTNAGAVCLRSEHNLNHVISEGIGIRSLGKTSRTTAQVDVDEGHVNVKSGAAAGRPRTDGRDYCTTRRRRPSKPLPNVILRDAPALSGLSHQLPKRKNKILIKKKSRRVSKRPQCQDHLQLHPHEAIEQFQSNPSREFPKIASTATNHTHRKFKGGMERCPGAQSTAMAPRELDEVSEPRVPPELRGDSTPFNRNGLPEAGTASE
ncbi:hypothetical protein EDB85DRAFT_1891877 [Lactarius pseudohatsudake]|nr:hypothetical protein EDB85DRAFT_1891877 [Lactarius pseudohatsudake]